MYVCIYCVFIILLSPLICSLSEKAFILTHTSQGKTMGHMANSLLYTKLFAIAPSATNRSSIETTTYN